MSQNFVHPLTRKNPPAVASLSQIFIPLIEGSSPFPPPPPLRP